jgi:hypothetical protein
LFQNFKLFSKALLQLWLAVFFVCFSFFFFEMTDLSSHKRKLEINAKEKEEESLQPLKKKLCLGLFGQEKKQSQDYPKDLLHIIFAYALGPDEWEITKWIVKINCTSSLQYINCLLHIIDPGFLIDWFLSCNEDLQVSESHLNLISTFENLHPWMNILLTRKFIVCCVTKSIATKIFYCFKNICCIIGNLLTITKSRLCLHFLFVVCEFFIATMMLSKSQLLIPI